MKRKVLSVMLCAAMVVSMTACGGSDAKENTASANASVSETEQGEATEQDAQEEEPITCTLTVWSPSEDQDPEYGQWLTHCIDLRVFIKTYCLMVRVLKTQSVQSIGYILLFCLKPLSLNYI